MGTAIEPSIMVPTEDTVEALLDHLVFPLLPIRESKGDLPTTHQQEVVAKQMHAAVMLYNYYHRKQFPKLEFLGFESFCKAASIAKPGLLMYMRYMHRCEEDLVDLNNQLSITEKMVMDACNTCTGLDALKDAPNIEGWPISKVAVFLIDPTKKKCLLQFCSITQGVWSLVEKNLETPYEKTVGRPQMKTHALDNKTTADGFSENESCENEEVLEQLALSVVEQETGISHSDLSILGRHLTYSLGHEKTIARLYIMKYERVVGEELMEVPIKDVISSLKGPIVKRGLTPEVTSVVEYYHMLPYIEIISNWLSREATHGGSLDMLRQQIVNENHSLEPDRMPTMEDHEMNKKSDLNEQKVNVQTNKMIESDCETTKTNRNDLSPINGLSGAVSRPQSRAGSSCVEPDRLTTMKDQAVNDNSFQNGKAEDILNSSKNNIKDAITYSRKVGGSCMSGSSGDVYSFMVLDEKHSLEPDRMPAIDDHENNKKSDLNEQKVNIQSDKMIKSESENIKNITDLSLTDGSSGAVIIPQNRAGSSCVGPDRLTTMKEQAINDKSFQNGQIEDIVNSKKNKMKNAIMNNRKVGGSCMSGSSGAVYSCKADISSLSHHQELSHNEEDIMGKNISSGNSNDKNEKNSIQDGVTVSVDGLKDKAGMVESVKKACVTKCTDGGRTYNSDAKQDEISTVDLPLVPMQFSSNNHGTFYHVMASKKNDLLQASLRVLQKRRDELCQQQRLIDDEIARCEMNIQTILSEGEENLTSKVESIIEACDILCSSQMQIGTTLSSEERCPSQMIKRRRLSEAVLTTRNTCQELDDICHKNSWILPRYCVLPSFADGQITGSFQASVTVQGMDFECTVGGDLKSNPREARDSAATHMLSKLRSMAGQEQ